MKLFFIIIIAIVVIIDVLLVYACCKADSKEAGRGEWVQECKNRYKCSKCGHGRNTDTQIGWNYCPNCGAKMDGK